MTHDERRDLDTSYPAWEPTDWTSRQRTAAIMSLWLLGLSCALIAYAFNRWGTGPLALNTFVPIGMTLLCLGTALLTYVFWYAYKHGNNSVGDNATTVVAVYVMLVLEGLVALGSLALQIIGGIVVATVGWQGWEIFSSISYWAPAGACLLVSVMLSIGATVLKWRPTRNPAAPGSALSAPVTGARLTLRWFVMALASNGWLLIGGAISILLNIWGEKYVENVGGNGSVLEAIALFGSAAALLFVAVLIEMTHHARATTPEVA